MKRAILSILLVMLLPAAASAESFVWQAQKGKSIIYLGGTVHVLREADYPLPPEFDKAYRASEVVVFETDFAKLQDPSTQQKVVTKATYHDGSTIESHLSAQAYGELRAYCEANGIPLETLSRLKPSLLMVTVTLMQLMKMGVTQHGVDSFFYEMAKKDKKAVKGLETVDEQVEYLLSMADGNEDQFVAHSLKDMKNMKRDFEAIAHAWRKGDAGKLDKLMVAELKTQQPKLHSTLIAERNKKWLPLIEGYLQTPSVEFILVGAAHLVGPDGIIDSLKKKGYTVEKL